MYGSKRLSQEPEAAAGTNRRAFLRSSGGYATGIAAIGIPTAAVLDTDADAATKYPAAKSVANPTADPPDEPVMAFIQDYKTGTVVIMKGTTEHTVQDRELVHRLITIPKATKKKKHKVKKKPKKAVRKHASTATKG